MLCKAVLGFPAELVFHKRRGGLPRAPGTKRRGSGTVLLPGAAYLCTAWRMPWRQVQAATHRGNCVATPLLPALVMPKQVEWPPQPRLAAEQKVQADGDSRPLSVPANLV